MVPASLDTADFPPPFSIKKHIAYACCRTSVSAGQIGHFFRHVKPADFCQQHYCGLITRSQGLFMSATITPPREQKLIMYIMAVAALVYRWVLAGDCADCGIFTWSDIALYSDVFDTWQYFLLAGSLTALLALQPITYYGPCRAWSSPSMFKPLTRRPPERDGQFSASSPESTQLSRTPVGWPNDLPTQHGVVWCPPPVSRY